MTKKVETVIDDETTADVVITKRPDGKTDERITIKNAKVKETETAIDTDTEQPENDFSDFENANYPQAEEIPKTKIDVFFEQIREALENENDSFFIKLIRTVDGLDDMFYYPNASDDTIIGRFVCYLKDEYRITETIQRKNNNSGGRFNLLAFDKNNNLLQVYSGSYFDKDEKRQMPILMSVVMRDVFIPNPLRDENAKTEVKQNSNDDKFLQFMAQSQNQFNTLIAKISEKPQPTLLEKALEQKMINDLTNPPQPAQQSGMLADIVKNELFQIKAIGQMFPETVTPPAKTTFDSIVEVANSDAGLELIETIKTIGATIAARNLGNISNVLQPMQATPQAAHETQNPHQPTQLDSNTENMHVLIEKIIDELDSENEINNDNETIKELQTDYAPQYEMIKSFCNMMSFEMVFSNLITLTQTMQPSPFYRFLNVEETNKTGAFVWNERGVRLQGRLLEVYNLAKETE